MSVTLDQLDESSPTDPLEGFTLQVRVIPDAVSDDGLVPCGTGDGCGQTCASACANSGV
ncbi:FxLD family lanthipeptide [Halostreptopolyspora alba]|uniref:FxLD family lantipeptide n=1 Tax=Halostreptopolyspora alba TaxID=2487137 RepID=A0A3N0ECK0_9ACTN|nr:FxLD family lantipeptide [Nocardiopsaceae bacterium YIM 96095]